VLVTEGHGYIYIDPQTGKKEYTQMSAFTAFVLSITGVK
jgi:hypothetical protein